MGSMACELTQGAKFAAEEREMASAAAKMKEAMEAFERLAEDDILSFEAYMTALKLPKQSEEQKSLRAAALSAAAIQATEAPLALIFACRDALLLLNGLSERVNPHVISDLGVGAFLLEAAAQSALLTVEINLPSVKDPERRDKYRREAAEAVALIASKKAEIAAVVLRRIRS
jgi:formiminotetrahydrofolate cyclodeaminase